MKSGVSYSVRIKRSAAKEMAGVPQPLRTRVADAISRLAEQPLAGHPLKGGLRGLRRLHMGDYRVIYELLEDELVILAIRVVHRRAAYRRRS